MGLATTMLLSFGAWASAGVSAPVSTITTPSHRGIYAHLPSIDAVAAASGLATVDAVQVSLKMKMANGNCKGFNGVRFVTRSCAKPRWLDAAPNGFNWSYAMPNGFLFRPSDANSTIAHYVVSTRSQDSVGTFESTFELGRNVSRFEIVGAP